MDHGTAHAPAILLALQDGPLGQAMRQSLYLYPAVEIMHLLAIALLVGSILALDLRLVGWRAVVPSWPLARHLLPIAGTGFSLAVLSGLLLFTTEAASLAFNPAFRIKLLLLLLAGLNALLLHRGPWRDIGQWSSAPKPPARVRVAALLSAVLWVGVLSFGRLIAYL